MPTNPYTAALMPATTAADTSPPLPVPTQADAGGEFARVTLSLTWVGDKPADTPANTVTVYRINSAHTENVIGTLTPSRPRWRDLPPDMYVVRKGVSEVAIGVDVSGYVAPDEP